MIIGGPARTPSRGVVGAVRGAWCTSSGPWAQALVITDPYDALGEGYAAHNEVAPYNALDERPAMLALLGDVAGQDVLEPGCGPGVMSEALVEPAFLLVEARSPA